MNERLAHGATVVLDNVTPETVAEWNRRLDLHLELHDDIRFNAARGTDRKLLGLTHYDFCWVLRGEKQAIARYPLARGAGGDNPIVHAETSMVRWEDYQMTAEQHKVGMMLRRLREMRGRRPLMVEVKRGPGRIIVNQLLLREAAGPFRPRALRILSRLLDDIGVARDDRVSPLAPREARGVDKNGYITQWLVAGPFQTGEGHPLDHAFIDESAIAPRTDGETWLLALSPHPYVDLNVHWPNAPASDRVAYASVYVYSSFDRSVLLDAPDMIELRAAADGGDKPFLNGQALGRFDFVRELVVDSDRVPGLPLKKGWNVLTIKTHNRSGPWRFAARLITSSGTVPGDLIIQAGPPDEPLAG